MPHDQTDVPLLASRLAKAPSRRNSSLWDILTIGVVVIPILGTFQPLDLYLEGAEGSASVASAPSSGTTISTYVVACSLLILIIYSTFGNSFPIARRLGSVLFFAYTFVALSTVIWSPDPIFTINRSVRLVPYIGFGLIIIQYYDLDHLLRLLTRSFFITISLSIIVTLVRPDLGLSQIGGGYEYAWRGATIHKNILGQVCSVSVLVCSVSIVCRSNNFLFSLLTLSLSTMTLVLSQSATSAAAAGASLAVAASLGAAMRSSLKAKIGIFAAMAVVATFVIAIATEPDLISAFVSRDATLTGRTYIWAGVAAAIDRSPFWGEYYGFWGADSTARAAIWQQVGYHVPHSHDSWLDIWLQLGMPGLLVLISICVVIILTAARLYLRSADPLAGC